MRKTMKHIGRLSVAVLLACTGLTHANLLTNPGFETQGVGGVKDADGWFQTAGWVERLSDANAPSGNYVLQIGDSDNGWHWASQRVAATPGVEYTASSLIKAYMPSGPNGDDDVAYIYMEWLNSTGGSLGNAFSTYTRSDADYADFGWISRSIVATAPVDTVEVEVRVMGYMPNDDGTSGMWFDDAALVPEPATMGATMGLFGLMGGAMLWARRRFKK